MKVKTVGNLLERMDRDLIWRKKELEAIKTLVENSQGSDLKMNIRIGVLLLYAHWEGYIKNSAICYIIYLSQFKFKYNELTENFLALSLRGNFNICADTHKVSDNCSIVDILINKIDQETKISYKHKEVIPRIGILESNLFFEILCIIGIEKSSFELKKQFIDRVLVQNRNEVAHGKDTQITKDEFDKMFTFVTETLELIRNEIYKGAKSEAFKKRTPAQVLPR